MIDNDDNEEITIKALAMMMVIDDDAQNRNSYNHDEIMKKK